MVVGLLLSHQVGAKLVASTLGVLGAVTSKLLWPRPELNQYNDYITLRCLRRGFYATRTVGAICLAIKNSTVII